MLRARQIEQRIAIENQSVKQGNQSRFALLQRVTGQKLADEPSVWWDWWQDYNDRYQSVKPTYTQYVTRVDSPPVEALTPPPTPGRSCECFAAGTLVRLQRGLKPIDEIRVGDRVLSQSPETGELTYKIVLDTTLQPDSAMCVLKIGDESIQCTLGHPFWVDGEGWRMARHLQVGDRLHTIDGTATIDAIEKCAAAPAYNLIVEDFHAYFVGEASVLAHDHVERQPTTALSPGVHRRAVVRAGK